MCENPNIIYKNQITGAYSEFKFDYKLCRQDDFIEVPCRKCSGCQEDYKSEMAYRAMAEISENHGVGMFITLTVNEDYIDEIFPNRELRHKPFQDFMKRLRRHIDKEYEDLPDLKPTINYLMSGEYGELNERPHYHACIFGYRFNDLVELPSVNSKYKTYRSRTLEKLWKFGFSTVGSIVDASVKYLAKYVVKKHSDIGYCRIKVPTQKVMEVDGKKVKYDSFKYVDGRVNMSTGEVYPFKAPYIVYPRGKNGGLGYRYFLKNYKRMFKLGYVMLENGNKISIPTYFKRKCKEMFFDVFNEWQENAIKRKEEQDREILNQNPDLEVTPIQLIQEMFPGVSSMVALEMMDKEDTSLTSVQKKSLEFQSKALTRINLHIWKLQQAIIKGANLRNRLQIAEIKKINKRRDFMRQMIN